MRLKILRTVGKKDTLGKTSDNPNSLELPAKEDGSMYQEGEVADFSKEDAEKFIKSGMGEETGEPVGPPPKVPVSAIPYVEVPREETAYAAPKEPVPAPASASRSAAAANYDQQTVAELHDEAEKRGLAKSGTKDELVARLKADDRQKAKR